jgi:hypothetical protein
VGNTLARRQILGHPRGSPPPAWGIPSEKVQPQQPRSVHPHQRGEYRCRDGSLGHPHRFTPTSVGNTLLRCHSLSHLDRTISFYVFFLSTKIVDFRHRRSPKISQNRQLGDENADSRSRKRTPRVVESYNFPTLTRNSPSISTIFRDGLPKVRAVKP